MKRRSLQSLRRKLGSVTAENRPSLENDNESSVDLPPTPAEAPASPLLHSVPTRGGPFPYQERLAFENSILKAYVKRDQFKRRSKFALDCGKYSIRFEYTSHGARHSHPTLLTLSDALRDCLKAIMVELRDYYRSLEVPDQSDASIHRQVYIDGRRGGEVRFPPPKS